LKVDAANGEGVGLYPELPFEQEYNPASEINTKPLLKNLMPYF